MPTADLPPLPYPQMPDLAYTGDDMRWYAEKAIATSPLPAERVTQIMNAVHVYQCAAVRAAFRAKPLKEHDGALDKVRALLEGRS